MSITRDEWALFRIKKNIVNIYLYVYIYLSLLFAWRLSKNTKLRDDDPARSTRAPRALHARSARAPRATEPRFWAFRVAAQD